MRYAQIYYYYGDTFMLITERFCHCAEFYHGQQGKIRNAL